MRTIIAGSRTIIDYELLENILVETLSWNISTVVSGGARGVDALGERYAWMYDLPLEIYPADWNKYGRLAGIVRNTQMAEVAEAAVILWDGFSKGSLNMYDIANKKKLKTILYDASAKSYYIK